MRSNFEKRARYKVCGKQVQKTHSLDSLTTKMKKDHETADIPPDLDKRLASLEKERLEAMFKRLDLNQDGLIDAEELAEGLRKMGYFHVTQEQVQVQKA